MNDEMMYLLIPFISDWRIEAGSGHVANESSRQSEDPTVGIFMRGMSHGKLRPYLRKAIISESGAAQQNFWF
jgi:hypothetical protein